MSNQFDVAVIGAGPGGYVAAIRLAQLGKRVALIEMEKIGGTCLNVGCIPSKALLDSSEKFHDAKNGMAVHGIEAASVTMDIAQMMKRKTAVVEQTVKGVAYLIQKNKISLFSGTAAFKNVKTLLITTKTGQSEITADSIVIATGSEPSALPQLPFDGEQIIDSTRALNFNKIPNSMVVIGGGAIGVELGSVYAKLGTKVSLIEFMDTLIPSMDSELGKVLEKSLKKIGMDFYLQSKVTEVKKTKHGVTVAIEDKAKQSQTLTVDVVLVAVGRRPVTGTLNLGAIGVTLDERGRIPVNSRFETAAPNIYAIGDVIAGPMLAHKASEEGVACAEIIAGQTGHVNYNTVPGVVYTHPEVAAVGETEAQLLERNIAFKKGSFPFKASARARASEETDGFVKILSDATSDEILGVQIIGPRAADMIHEAVVAMDFRASAKDIARICHAHPTYSEAVKEAALGATANRPIHL